MKAPSARARVRRNARRAEYDPEILREVLKSQQICHVAYVEDGEPRQITTLYFTDDDFLYLHGNRQAALLRHIGSGGEVAINVVLVDGVVVARSGFHCSMNYRSVTVFGQGEEVTDGEHAAILDQFVDALVPGHAAAVRAPTEQELAATAVVRIPLTEMSGKFRSGDPIDDDADLDSNVWAGVIPVRSETGAPVASADLAPSVELPAYIRDYSYRG